MEHRSTVQENRDDKRKKASDMTEWANVLETEWTKLQYLETERIKL